MQSMTRVIRTEREQWDKGDTWLACREKLMLVCAKSRKAFSLTSPGKARGSGLRIVLGVLFCLCYPINVEI